MTLLDSSQQAPDQPFDKGSGAAALPTDEDVLGPMPEKHEAAGADLPTDEDVLGPRPEPWPQRPITGAVAPGPVGDWIFGNKDHSSLARISDAFGATVDQDIGHYGEKLGLSEETSKYLRDKGYFNDYVQGQHNIGKAFNEVLLRSGAILVNTAIYGVPAVWHGLQEAVMEAGQQTEGTALEKGFGALGLGKPSQLAREVAAVPEAFPDFNFRMGMPHAPVPEPLRAARDLNVIGPGGEAAWKGVTSSDRDIAPGGTPLPEILVEETGGPTVPVEAAAADEASLASAAAPDVHAIARSIAPETFTEFDVLEKRRDLFRKWIDDGGAQVPPNIAQNLKETEARLRELEPAVTAAYTKAKEGLPAITEAENAGGTEAANPAAGGAPEAQAAAAPAPAPEEGAVPAEGSPSQRVAGEAGAEAAPLKGTANEPVVGETAAQPAGAEPAGNSDEGARDGGANVGGDNQRRTPPTIEDQRDHIVNEVKQSLIDAGRPSEEAQAAAQLVAARYEARAGRFKGALGTPQELFDRESSDIRRMERVAKKTSAFKNPNSARAADNFAERMAEAKAAKMRERDRGTGSAIRIMSTAERFAGVTEEEFKSIQEEAVKSAPPEDQAQVRDDLDHLSPDDLAFVNEIGERGALWQRRTAPPGPNLFTEREGEGQANLPGTERISEAELAKRRAAEPLKPGVAQKPMDFGLFSDQAKQRELFQMLAYHGSPHHFERFDISKIGTGEGAQAYGHGLYFAENEGVAKGYRDTLSRSVGNQQTAAGAADRFVSLYGDGAADAIRREIASMHAVAQKLSESGRGLPQVFLDRIKNEYEPALEMVSKGYRPGGSLYRVSLKPDKEDLLDWERPLNQQNEKVTAGLKKFADLATKEKEEEGGFAPQSAHLATESDVDVETFQKQLHYDFDEITASRLLSEAGIPGIKYADQGSRRDPAPIKRDLDQVRESIALVEKQTDSPSQAERLANLRRDEASLAKEYEAAVNPTHNFVIFDDKDVEVTHRNGEALSKEERADAVRELYQRPELNQKALGSFRVIEGGRPILKLAKSANASTFIHESGHEWLEQLMRDDAHPLAPADLKADAKTVRDWLGIENHQDLNTGWPGARGEKAVAAHEKFARGFEEYLFHGVAPSTQLARVFAKFKTWLTTIYQTLEKLRKQAQETGAKDFVGINDDIRGVFDRMLAGEPQRVVAGAERESSPGLGERHEATEAATPPERARDVANTIQSERDFHATQDMINSYHDRLADVEPGTGSRAERVAQPSGHGDEARPEARSPGNDTEPGALGAGGSEAATAGNRAPPQPQPTVKTEPPPTGNAPFAPSAGKYTDKIGNFRIDGLNDPNQIFDALRENIEKTGGMVEQFRRGVTDGDLLNISLASGLKPEWLDGKKIGDAYSHREIKALEDLFIAASTAVKDTALAAATGEPTAILAQAEAMARMEMVQAHLAGASAEAGRALGAVRRVMKKAWGDGGRRTAAEAAASLDRVRQLSAQKWESPEALSAALKAETGRTLFQLQEMAEFAGKLDTPGRIARLVEDTSNGKMKQAVVFYYVNALLSGPVTHLKYAIGNAVTALYSPVRTAVAAGVDFGAHLAGIQNERRIFLGEAGTELYALGRGFTEGIAAGKEGWRIGTTPDLPGEGAPGLFGAQPIINPIPGKIGYAIGIPGKGVGMVHGFGAAMRYRQELNRLAYRTAMQEKLQGDAFISRLADLSDRPPPENMEAAAKVARSDLYMAPTDYNSISAGLARISDSSIVAKILLPFVKIGMQVESKAIANSPLALGAIIPGAKSLAPHIGNEIRADLSGVNGPEARNMRIGSMIGGTGLMTFAAGLVANGDMTGHGPHDKQKRDVWLALHKPYMVSVGPLSLNYQGWGYLGKLMAISANAYETHQGWGDEEGHSIATAYFQGFHEALFDDSFLRGVKDFVDAINDWDRYGARWASNMLLNWIPASVGMGQVSRLVDPYQRETHTSSDTILDTIFKEAWNKVPLASQWLYPKRDVFGQPIPSGPVIGGALTGLPIPNYSNDRTVKMLNSLHIGISDVHDQIRGVKLTDKQFDDYKVIAGVLTKSRLDDMMQTTGQHLAATGRPEDRAKLIEIVHKIVTRSREEAAKTVMMHAYGSDNDIVAKATEAKKVKKGLIPAPTVH